MIILLVFIIITLIIIIYYIIQYNKKAIIDIQNKAILSVVDIVEDKIIENDSFIKIDALDQLTVYDNIKFSESNDQIQSNYIVNKNQYIQDRTQYVDGGQLSEVGELSSNNTNESFTIRPTFATTNQRQFNHTIMNESIDHYDNNARTKAVKSNQIRFSMGLQDSE